MKPLYKSPTKKDPEIDFHPDGILWIRGRSIQEDAMSFYFDLFNWMDKYASNPPAKTEFHIQLTNHNDTASKYILHLLKNISWVPTELVVKWYYEDWDEEIIFLGEMMSQCLGFDFEFIKIQQGN